MADIADIAKLDDEMERTIKWALYYYEKWNELPNQQQQSTLEAFWEHENAQPLDELISKEDGYKKLVAAVGQQAANKAMLDGLNRLVAQEIVKESLGGVKTEEGKKGAVFIAEKSAKLAAARGENVAISGAAVVASLPVNITARKGEMVRDARAGIKTHHAKNALGRWEIIPGRPIGAIADPGIFADVGSWSVGKTITALLNTVKALDDNDVYIKIGDIGNDELCIGTYAANEKMYLKTYWKEYKKNNAECQMSAGQAQNGAFQLCRVVSEARA